MAHDRFGTDIVLADGSRLTGGMVTRDPGGGGGGGGGARTVANAGGLPYQSPPVGETQAQMVGRQQARRNSSQQQKVENIAALVGKLFGF